MIGTIAKTTQGEVQGREKDGVLLFAGIPYAAPPTGARRFRAPEPHDRWAGIRDARRFGPAAPQPREEGLTAKTGTFAVLDRDEINAPELYSLLEGIEVVRQRVRHGSTTTARSRQCGRYMRPAACSNSPPREWKHLGQDSGAQAAVGEAR